MTQPSLYGGVSTRRITIRDLQAAKERGERWPMLTAYDYSTARVFDEAGIPVLLVGDSAANVVYGYDTTVPVTVEELLPLVRGVVRGTKRALVDRAEWKRRQYPPGPKISFKSFGKDRRLPITNRWRDERTGGQ